MSKVAMETVSDEAVEAALNAWWGDDWPTLSVDEDAGTRQDMRAALTAASSIAPATGFVSIPLKTAETARDLLMLYGRTPAWADLSDEIDRRIRSFHFPLSSERERGAMSIDWKSFWLGAFVVYALVAVMSGTAMSRAIPALNALGGVYVGLTWPGAMFCSTTQIEGCTVLPSPGSPFANAFFTFKDRRS